MPLGPNRRMTTQRRMILDSLRSVTSHPTADDVYEMVRQKLPRISLGTVYRNLETLANAGVIQRLEVGGTQRRYDGAIESHPHGRCLSCGRVVDMPHLPAGKVAQPGQSVAGFTIATCHVEYLGYCSHCAGTYTEDNTDTVGTMGHTGTQGSLDDEADTDNMQ